MSHSKTCWWLHRDCLCNTCQRDRWPESCCVKRGKWPENDSCCVTACEAYQEEPWEDITRYSEAEWLLRRLRKGQRK